VRESNRGCSVKVHLVLERGLLSGKGDTVWYRVNDNDNRIVKGDIVSLQAKTNIVHPDVRPRSLTSC
jgi:hypothetical protein